MSSLDLIASTPPQILSSASGSSVFGITQHSVFVRLPGSAAVQNVPYDSVAKDTSSLSLDSAAVSTSDAALRPRNFEPPTSSYRASTPRSYHCKPEPKPEPICAPQVPEFRPSASQWLTYTFRSGLEDQDKRGDKSLVRPFQETAKTPSGLAPPAAGVTWEMHREEVLRHMGDSLDKLWEEHKEFQKKAEEYDRQMTEYNKSCRRLRRKERQEFHDRLYEDAESDESRILMVGVEINRSIDQLHG